jgi:hypothetical protein
VETVHVRRIEPGLAASRLQGLEAFDPAGTTTASDIAAMAERGQCFTVGDLQDAAVYVVRISNGIAWISACMGSGPTPWARVLLPVIEQQADGCSAVAFQTARRGLVRQAQAQGYEITGWIMKKKLK